MLNSNTWSTIQQKKYTFHSDLLWTCSHFLISFFRVIYFPSSFRRQAAEGRFINRLRSDLPSCSFRSSSFNKSTFIHQFCWVPKGLQCRLLSPNSCWESEHDCEPEQQISASGRHYSQLNMQETGLNVPVYLRSDHPGDLQRRADVGTLASLHIQTFCPSPHPLVSIPSSGLGKSATLCLLHNPAVVS